MQCVLGSGVPARYRLAFDLVITGGFDGEGALFGGLRLRVELLEVLHHDAGCVGKEDGVQYKGEEYHEEG